MDWTIKCAIIKYWGSQFLRAVAQFYDGFMPDLLSNMIFSYQTLVILEKYSIFMKVAPDLYSRGVNEYEGLVKNRYRRSYYRIERFCRIPTGATLLKCS